MNLNLVGKKRQFIKSGPAKVESNLKCHGPNEVLIFKEFHRTKKNATQQL